MTPEQILSFLAMDTGERILAIDPERAFRTSRTEAASGNATSVAIIPLQGTLRPRGSGGMDLFRQRVQEAAANPDIGAIVLDVDSPGGTVAGTKEAAQAVRDAGQSKSVTAVVDSLAASAAYWIASQAGSIVLTPSADVGSIGVLCIHMEVSKALADFGVAATIMRSVKFKAEGNPFEPLSEEAKANIQDEIDAAHSDFIKAVAAGRRTSQAKVSADFGQGRTVGAQKAVDLGMADRIGTMADVLSGMRTKGSSFRRRAAFAF